ncbi:MAG: thioesterase [Bacteroidia bacterium]|nr:thioesterase [Bacteroidia bacterium]
MELQQLEKEYGVHVYETGPDGRASLWSLFNYMQDSASEHAVKLGFGRDDLMKKNHFWVLSRMFAVFHELPFWNDTIIVKTWPCGTDKFFAMRNYEIKFPGGRDIAYGSSSWLIIDRTTKKIQRPDDTLTRYNSEYQLIKPPLRSAVKLAGASKNGSVTVASKVKISDLDINLHTNNANYFKWVTDSYDLNFILTHSPQSAEINYLAESMHDEDFIIRTSKDEDDKNIFNHSVFRISDNRELCRLRIEWMEESKKNENLI